MQVQVANMVWQHHQLDTEKSFWSAAATSLKELQLIGVQLVLLPGLTGLLHAQAAWAGRGYDPSYSLAPIAQQREAFEHGFSTLAAQYRLYLCPGTTVTEENGVYYMIASLFNPQGEKVGEQRQTHLSQQERALGLGRGQVLTSWTTTIGQVGLVVGTDIWYPEVSRILALQGANLVLAPAAVPTPYNRWLQVAAMWQQVQQNQFFALENWFDGELCSVTYGGTAPILAPCTITPEETGYLADGKKELIAGLDFTRRETVIKDFPLLDYLNRPLYQHYLPKLYERGATYAPDHPAGKSP